MMSQHYVLFYFFHKDKEKHLLSEEKKCEILKNLEIFYKELKPPWQSSPPNS